MDQNAQSVGLNILGIGGKRTTTRDTIGIDVRIIEVDSGIVADAIKVRKQIKGSSPSVGGIGDAITNNLSQQFLGGYE
jgi:curli biogenesis system outer membrane secretion channel CsgG